MRLVVIDLEMNQPSGKIIQIGAVVVNIRSGKIENGYVVLVDPGELISDEIANLTGITNERIQNGGVMPDVAFAAFWKWFEEKKVGGNIAAWGSDVWVLKEASKAAGVKYPAKLHNMDIKAVSQVFRSALPNGTKNRGGLKNTLHAFDLPFEGREHDAFDDARNTALLLCHFQEIVFKSLTAKTLFSEWKRIIPYKSIT